MTCLDSIFASYPSEGFQDIWFGALEPNEVVHLFNYACQTYGQAAPRAFWDPEEGVCCSECKLPCIEYEFPPLLIGNTVLDGIAIRVECNELAIDFDSGLDYWNPERQAAFINWLRDLHQQVPNAQLAWAHEGCEHNPSERESELLRLAVSGLLGDVSC